RELQSRSFLAGFFQPPPQTRVHHAAVVAQVHTPHATRSAENDSVHACPESDDGSCMTSNQRRPGRAADARAIRTSRIAFVSESERRPAFASASASFAPRAT